MKLAIYIIPFVQLATFLATMNEEKKHAMLLSK